MNNTVGVVIGRFQIDTLHDGHIALLDYVEEHCSRMAILIGVRPAEASDRNPLDYEARAMMLQEYYSKATILPIVDYRSDEAWSKNVDGLIQTVYGINAEVVIHIGRDSFALHYKGKYPIEEHSFGEASDKLSASEFRTNLRGEIPSNESERRGVIHAFVNMPHRFTLMVDMFVTRGDGRHSYEILVGKKLHEDQWRLPGGHVDRGENFCQAASRELVEETGIHLSEGWAGWKIVGDFDVPDWRVRDTDRITYKTVLMVGEHSWGVEEAGSDLVEVAWLPVEEVKKLRDTLIVEEHRHLVANAIRYLDKNPPYFITNPVITNPVSTT